MYSNKKLLAQPPRLKHCSSMACERSISSSKTANMETPIDTSVPWWLKSKQPSTQIRSLDTGTSSWGSTGQWPTVGIFSPSILSDSILVFLLGLPNLPRGELRILLLTKPFRQVSCRLMDSRQAEVPCKSGKSLQSLRAGLCPILLGQAHVFGISQVLDNRLHRALYSIRYRQIL